MRDARRRRGWAHAELAEGLGTSQSAVNRIERGGQNVSVHMLARIGEVLDTAIVSLAAVPTHLRVDGNRSLHGEIDVLGSKNASVALLCASLLNRGSTTLRRIARIEEVHRLVEVLRSLGVQVQWSEDGADLIVRPPRRLRLASITREPQSAFEAFYSFSET